MQINTLEALLSATSTMLVEVDEAEVITKVTNCRLFDYEPAQLVGKSLAILLTPEEQDSLVAGGSAEALVMTKTRRLVPCEILLLSPTTYAFCSKETAKAYEQLARAKANVPILQARLQGERDRLRARIATIAMGVVGGLVASLLLASTSGKLSDEASNNVKDLVLVISAAATTAVSGIFATPSSQQPQSSKEPEAQE